MKRSLRAAAGLAVTLVLAGCASDAPDDSAEETLATADGCSPSGAEVESIEILGEFGDAPEVTFDAPVSAVLTQRLVVIEGDGPEVADGDILSIDYSLYNAATGDLIEES